MNTPIWRRVVVAILGLALGGAGLFWATRNVDIAEAKSIFETADWRWIVTGVMLFGGDLLLRTMRWRLILSHRADIGYATLARGLFVGYAVNVLLPARLGELFRVDYTARLVGVSRAAILASIFVERLVDLLTVMVLFGVGLTLAGIQNPDMNRVILVGGAGFAIGVLLVSVTILPGVRSNVKRLLEKVTSRLFTEPTASRAMGMSRGFAELMGIVRTRRFGIVLILSIPIWIIELLSVFSVCRSVGLVLTPVSSMVLLGGASLSTLFPTAPGFIGSYQFAFVMILRNFGVADTIALVAATSVQLYLMGLYAVLGVFTWSVFPAFTPSFAPREVGNVRMMKS